MLRLESREKKSKAGFIPFAVLTVLRSFWITI
jgi:hypothetical protein